MSEQRHIETGELHGWPGGLAETGPTEAELRENSELAHLYRPLDQDDREWMEQLGCDWCYWPDADDYLEEPAWLELVKDLVVIGQEAQSNRPGKNAILVYRAREKFLDLLPIAKEAHTRMNTYDRSAKASQVLPLDSFVSAQRAIHGLGVHNGRVMARIPFAMKLTGRNVMDVVNVAERHDLDLAKMTKAYEMNWLTLGATALSRRLEVLYGITRIWGVTDYMDEVKRFSEKHPVHLNRSPHVLLTLARIGSELFGGYDIHRSLSRDATQVIVTRTDSLVAAYLARSDAISTPQGLTYQARRLQERYPPEVLRGYIVAHAGNKVVNSYLRATPVTEAEADHLQLFDELPEPTAWWTDSTYDSKTWQRSARASNLPEFLHFIKGAPEAGEDDCEIWFTEIAAGLEVEESYVDPFLYDDDEKQKMQDGRMARTRLHTAFAKQVLEIRYRGGERAGRHMFPENNDDAVQDGMLMLMIAILDLAYRHPEDRPASPDAVWSFLEERIRSMEKHGFAEDDEDDEGEADELLYVSSGRNGEGSREGADDSVAVMDRLATAEQVAALLDRYQRGTV